MSSNIIDHIRIGQSNTRADINQLLTQLQDLNAADPEDPALQERLIKHRVRRNRTTTVTTGAPTQLLTNNRDRDGTLFFTREPENTLPLNVYHSIIHTTVGSPTFPSTGTTFGCITTLDGANDYFKIDHVSNNDLDLDFADAFTLAGWFKRADTGTQEALIFKRNGTQQSLTGYCVFMNAVGRIIFEMCNGTVDKGVQSGKDNDDGNWHSFIATYGGNGNFDDADMYVDAVKTTGLAFTFTGSMKNSLFVAIGAESDTGLKLTGSMALVTMLKSKVDQAWATDFNAGRITTDGQSSITVIPFDGSAAERPDASCGLTKVG